MKKRIYILSLCIAINKLFACTIISVSDSSNSFIGSNWDIPKHDIKKFGDLFLWTKPSKNGKYGAIYLGMDPSLSSATSGLNEKGLFYDWASLENKVTMPFDKEKPSLVTFMPYKILDECSNIEQAIRLINNYNWLSGAQGGHMLIADSFGNSAVVEWLNGELFITRGNKNQVMTNIPIVNCSNNYKGCWRLKKAHKMLDNHPVSKENLEKTLRAVTQPTTLISRIIDLRKGEIIIYYKQNINDKVVINLEDELKKEIHYYCIPSLFNEKLKKCSSTFHDMFYYDKNWKKLTSKRKAIYYRKIMKDDLTSGWIIKDYYLKGNTIQYEAVCLNYESIILNLLNGKVTWYYENGNKSCEGFKFDYCRTGKWKYWSKEGDLIKEVTFDCNIILEEKYFTNDEIKKKKYSSTY